jgi:hypothetical protein
LTFLTVFATGAFAARFTFFAGAAFLSLTGDLEGLDLAIQQREGPGFGKIEARYLMAWVRMRKGKAQIICRGNFH